MKRIFGFSLIFLVFLIGIVSAATDTNNVDDSFRLNERIDYKKPCFNNGTYCSASAVCNYTIFKPNNEILIYNNQSTNQNSFHNLTFYVTDIGVHRVDMVCVDGTLKGAETLYFEVTGSGFNNTFGFYIMLIVFSVGVMALGFYKDSAPIVIFRSFGLYFLGLFILFNGLAGIKDPVYTWSSGIIVLALAFYISTKSTYELIVD